MPLLDELERYAREGDLTPASLNKLIDNCQDLQGGKKIVPNPGFVVKTKDKSGTKIFINICWHDDVEGPDRKLPINPDGSPVKDIGGPPSQAMRLPMSTWMPRVERDHTNAKCMVVDCTFNTDVIRFAEVDTEFKNMVIRTALSWCGQRLNRGKLNPNFKLPKMRSKGEPQPQVVRGKTVLPLDPFEKEKQVVNLQSESQKLAAMLAKQEISRSARDNTTETETSAGSNTPTSTVSSPQGSRSKASPAEGKKKPAFGFSFDQRSKDLAEARKRSSQPKKTEVD